MLWWSDVSVIGWSGHGGVGIPGIIDTSVMPHVGIFMNPCSGVAQPRYGSYLNCSLAAAASNAVSEQKEQEQQKQQPEQNLP